MNLRKRKIMTRWMWILRVLALLVAVGGATFVIGILITINPNELSSNGIVWDFFYNWIPFMCVSIVFFLPSMFLEIDLC